MSRIGRKPILIPEGVQVSIDEHSIVVRGPKGELKQQFRSRIQFEIKDSQVIVTVEHPDNRKSRELWGLSRVLLANMIEGVTKGFEKKLELIGVGYRASLSGKKLVLNVGYSHPVEFLIPENIEVKVDKNIIMISGINKQQVGEVAARIRSVKKPEPYKGKGIKYIDEVIRRKAGKVMKAAGTGT